RRNIVLGNGSAKNIIDEFEVAAAWQRLHLDLAIAVLSMATGLLLVTALHVGFAADRLPIRNLGRFEHDFSVVTLLELCHHNFDVLLACARNEKLLGLRIAIEAQHGVFFNQFMNAIGELVSIGASLGLDRDSDRRLQ